MWRENCSSDHGSLNTFNRSCYFMRTIRSMRTSLLPPPVAPTSFAARSPWLGLLLAVAFVPGNARAQNPDEPLHTASRVELDVVKVLLAQEKSWNKGDIGGFMDGYKNSPETLLVARQVSKGYNEIETEYKRDYPNQAAMGQLGYSELEVFPLGETYAVCVGHYHLERGKKEGGGADGLFSDVLEKTPAGWKIVLDHTT